MIDFFYERSSSRAGYGYEYHVILNSDHLFGREYLHKQDIPKAMFGFGQIDKGILSRRVIFPLFVRTPSEIRVPFCYMGDYAAVGIGSIAWERLSPEVLFPPLFEGISHLNLSDI
jgi:hypothetical protein